MWQQFPGPSVNPSRRLPNHQEASEILRITFTLLPMPPRTIATEHAALAHWRSLPKAVGCSL
eukprot:621943-Pyramimonas_sp.AAC.1